MPETNVQSPLAVEILEALEKADTSMISSNKKAIIHVARFKKDDIQDPANFDFFAEHPDIQSSSFDVPIEITEEEEDSGVEFLDKVKKFLSLMYIHQDPSHDEEFSYKLTPVKGHSNAFYIVEYVEDDDTGEKVYLGDITVFKFSEGFRRREIAQLRDVIAHAGD